MLRALLVETAGELGIKARDGGTVVVIQGPRFSTRAESKWFQDAGWDTINMTAYPEGYLARELELCYANISMVTDHDVGVEGAAPVSHEQVVTVFNENNERLRELLFAVIPKIPPQPEEHLCAPRCAARASSVITESAASSISALACVSQRKAMFEAKSHPEGARPPRPASRSAAPRFRPSPAGSDRRHVAAAEVVRHVVDDVAPRRGHDPDVAQVELERPRRDRTSLARSIRSRAARAPPLPAPGGRAPRRRLRQLLARLAPHRRVEALAGVDVPADRLVQRPPFPCRRRAAAQHLAVRVHDEQVHGPERQPRGSASSPASP